MRAYLICAASLATKSVARRGDPEFCEHLQMIRLSIFKMSYSPVPNHGKRLLYSPSIDTLALKGQRVMRG